MKKILMFCLIFFFSYIIFSDEPSENHIKRYMESRNQVYPININSSLRYSFYRDASLMRDLSLSNEQRTKLEKFVEIFLSDNKYIEQLQTASKTNTFSINNFFIEHYDWSEEDDFVLAITFYSENKLWEVWQFDRENNIWLTFNMASYKFSGDDIELMGWAF